jgi:hypothetical protein
MQTYPEFGQQPEARPPLQLPEDPFNQGPKQWGPAYEGLDMTGFKPRGAQTTDMINWSINGHQMSGSSSYAGELEKYLQSIGQGDAFSRPNNNYISAEGLPYKPKSISQPGGPGGGMQSSPEFLPNIGDTPSIIADRAEIPTSRGGQDLSGQDLVNQVDPNPVAGGEIAQPVTNNSNIANTALPNLNNIFSPIPSYNSLQVPIPSYDPPQVPEEQKITDPYQRAGGYKKQQATTPDEVINKGNTVTQAFGAQPGALNKALGLAYGGIAGMLGEPRSGYQDGKEAKKKDSWYLWPYKRGKEWDKILEKLFKDKERNPEDYIIDVAEGGRIGLEGGGITDVIETGPTRQQLIIKWLNDRGLPITPENIQKAIIEMAQGGQAPVVTGRRINWTRHIRNSNSGCS